jgi:hypothetical protein
MEIKVLNCEKYRKYSIKYTDGEEFIYPSVSSITAQLSEKGMFFWKKKVGLDVANKICEIAKLRGTRVHLLIEKYLKDKNDKPDTGSEDFRIFNNMKQYLDKISNILMQEQTIFSHIHKLAGTVDCIASYDGVLSVIDFKTAKKKKIKQAIEPYFIQCASYALCFNEMNPDNEQIKQLVLIIGVDDENTKIQILKSTLDEYLTGVVYYRNKFRKKYEEQN